jgi:hypothetical protein
VDQRVAALGIDVISPARGLELLDAATRGDAPHVAATPVRWDRFLEQRRDGHGRKLFERLAHKEHASRTVSAAEPAPGTGVLDLEALQQATAAHRREVLLAFIGDHVARVIGAPPGKPIPMDQPLNELGLDSLMAVDLRNRLSRGLQQARSLPATIVFQHPTVDALARHLETIVAPARPEQEAARPQAKPHDAVSDLDTLSDEQIEALFAARTEAE